MLNITRIPAFADNYLWLLQRDTLREVVVVDPGDADPIINIANANDWRVSNILLTHHHRDHCGGVAALKDRFNARVYGPAAESIAGVDEALQGNETLSIAELGAVKVLNLPGHTLGHIAYLIDHHLFSGDVLFGAGCGRLFEGTAVQMWHSLQQIMALPSNTLVYCAHEYTLSNLRFALSIEPENVELLQHQTEMASLRAQDQTTVPLTLAQEKRINPFLRSGDLALQKRVAQLSGEVIGDAASCFAQLRRMKDQFRS